MNVELTKKELEMVIRCIRFVQAFKGPQENKELEQKLLALYAAAA